MFCRKKMYIHTNYDVQYVIIVYFDDVWTFKCYKHLVY